MSPAFFYLARYQDSDVPQATIGGTLRLWFHRARQRARDRAALAEASELDLHDAGLSRGMLQFELAKPFWQA